MYPRNAIDAHWTNEQINRIMLPEHIHVNWHRVFWNLEFHHQIRRVLEMNSPIVQRHVLKEVSQIMNEDPKYIYENWVYRPKVGKHDTVHKSFDFI